MRMRTLLFLLSLWGVVPLLSQTCEEVGAASGKKIASLPAASSYGGCVSLVDDATSKNVLGSGGGSTVLAIVSNGSTWVLLDGPLAAGAGISVSCNTVTCTITVDATGAEISFSPTGDLEATDVQAAIEELDTEKQPLDSDLTIYAGITPTANTQSFLAAADYAAMRTLLALTIGVNVQAYDIDLTTYAGITPAPNTQAFLDAADYAAMKVLLGLVIGTNVQAYDTVLTTWAGITPGANVGTFLGTPSSSNLALALTDEVGNAGGFTRGTAGSTDDCVKWDANGNQVSAGAACGAGGGSLPSESGHTNKLLSNNGTTSDWRDIGAGLVVDPTSVRADPAIVAFVANANTWPDGQVFDGNITAGSVSDVDFSDANSTMSCQAGATPPGSCIANEECFVDTDLDPEDGEGQWLLCNDEGDGWDSVGYGGGGGGGGTMNVALAVVMGNGSDVLAAGVYHYIPIPFACTITDVVAGADVSGTVTVDIWKDTYANYPPTVADTIVASAPIALSTALKYADSTLSGWTTSIDADDWLGFAVNASPTPASITELTVALTCERSDATAGETTEVGLETQITDVNDIFTDNDGALDDDDVSDDLPTAMLNWPAGLTLVEMGYGADVTGLLQAQLDGKQPLDTELTELAGLSCSNGEIPKETTGSWACQADDTGNDSDDDVSDDALGALSNVTESDPGDGEVLRYETDHWENGTHAEANIMPADVTGIDAAKIGGGGVSTTEWDYLATLASNLQDQLDALANPPKQYLIEVFHRDTTVTTGDGAVLEPTIAVLSDNGYVLESVEAWTNTAGQTGTMIIDIARCTAAADGPNCAAEVAVLTDLIVIDDDETKTSTAATPPSVNTDNDDATAGTFWRIDVNSVHTTPATGLWVEFTFVSP